MFVDEDRLSDLGLTLSDLARFLEGQAFVFAVFTHDEVRRAAHAPKTLTPAQALDSCACLKPIRSEISIADTKTPYPAARRRSS